MPLYAYRTNDDRLYFLRMTMEEMSRRQNRRMELRLRSGEIDGLPAGTVVHRDMEAEHKGFRDTPGAWPLRSNSLGCNPKQIDEKQAYLDRVGVPTDFDRTTGEAILRSRQHRKRLAEIQGIYDFDGGYGDPQRN